MSVTHKKYVNWTKIVLMKRVLKVKMVNQHSMKRKEYDVTLDKGNPEECVTPWCCRRCVYHSVCVCVPNSTVHLL